MFAGIFIAFAVNQVCGQMRNQREKFLKEKDFLSSFSSPGSPSSKSLTSPISISQERQRRPLPIFPPGTRTRLVDPHSYLGFDPKVQLVETALHNPFLNPEVCTGEVVWVQEGSGKKEIFLSIFATTTSNQQGLSSLDLDSVPLGKVDLFFPRLPLSILSIVAGKCCWCEQCSVPTQGGWVEQHWAESWTPGGNSFQPGNLQTALSHPGRAQLDGGG